MAYALVTFDFLGKRYSSKKFLFQTSVEGLRKGDIVIVEYDQSPNGQELALFVRYVENDRYEIERKKLLKKVDKNTLNSIVKKRIEHYKDIEITKAVYKQYRKRFEGNENLEKEKIRKLLIRNICISPKTESKNTERYRFGSMMIVVKNKEIVALKRHDNGQKWIRPRIVEDIAKEKLGIE